MPTTSRTGFRVGVAGSGVTVFGGTPSGTVEVLDLSTLQWESRTSMPAIRAGLTVASGIGVSWVIGSAGPPCGSLIERFDGANWVALAPSGGICAGAAGYFDQNVYVVAPAMNSYSVLSDSWAVLAPCPLSAPLAYSSVAVAGTSVLVAMGEDRKSSTALHVYSYALSAGSWSNAPSLRGEREGCAATSLGGALYLIGGRKNKIFAIATVERLAHCWLCDGVWFLRLQSRPR